MKIYSSILFMLLSMVTISAHSQDKKETVKDNRVVTQSNDTIFLNGKGQFTVRTRTGGANNSITLASLHSFDGKLQALLNMTLVNDTLKFKASFPVLNVFYACLYPKVDLFVLMESYVKNKIMVDGVATKEGLEAYCKERTIILQEIPVKKVSKPGMDPKLDSLMAIRTKEHLDKKFTFTLSNKSKSTIDIFLGDTTASPNRTKNPNVIPFRQGRYEKVSAGEKKQLIGFEGEYVCITDSIHKIYDLRQLLKTMTELQVKSNGKSFE